MIYLLSSCRNDLQQSDDISPPHIGTESIGKFIPQNSLLVRSNTSNTGITCNKKYRVVVKNKIDNVQCFCLTIDSSCTNFPTEVWVCYYF